MDTPYACSLQRARSAAHVVVLTGAGVSAESGIPTFRDALTGYWSKFDARELATPAAFARDPALVSRWYDERRLRCREARPNPAHRALADWERLQAAAGRRFTLLTQNVDGLHGAAGSRSVVELHGSIRRWRCTGCGAETDQDGPAFAVHPPACGECRGVLRPAVVWFGEPLPEAALEAAGRALAECDLFVSIGTSAVVQPAASFLHAARQGGAWTMEINLAPTAASAAVDCALHGRAGELLPRFLAALAPPAG